MKTIDRLICALTWTIILAIGFFITYSWVCFLFNEVRK
jgi:hypothetical protein